MSVAGRIKLAGERIRAEELAFIAKKEQSDAKSGEIDSLILNHSYPASEVAKMVGMSLPTFKIFSQECLVNGVITEVKKISNQYKYTLWHIHALMNELNHSKWSDKFKKTNVINVANLKGGTGKSTTAGSLSVYFALRLDYRPRVLLIDLDPQGSQAKLANVDEDSEIITAVDIMLGDEEPNGVYQAYINEGLTHQEIVNGSIIETPIPNFHVMAATPFDERFDTGAFNKENIEDREKLKLLFKERVIDFLVDDYDIIFIDTPPRLSPLSASAIEASNGLLIPCTPKALDWKSTQNYFDMLPEVIEKLPSKGDNLDWFKVLSTNFDDEHDRGMDLLTRMKNAMGLDLFNSSIKRSQAYEVASQNNRTVMDLKKKDKLCSDRQLEKGVDSLKDVGREMFFMLDDVQSKMEHI
jgi:chromosome partitioning protein